MRPYATRMQESVAYIAANPNGVPMARVIAHLLAIAPSEKKYAYKQAAMVVERVIRDRLVRQDGNLLYPWDEKAKAYAEALERAMYAAPDEEDRKNMLTLAIRAWRRAGDENRANILERTERAR